MEFTKQSDNEVTIQDLKRGGAYLALHHPQIGFYKSALIGLEDDEEEPDSRDEAYLF